MSSKVDGRIVMDTEIDVRGAKEGVKNLTSEQIKVRNEYRKTAREIALLQEQIKDMETPKMDTSSLEKYEIEQTKITNEYKKTERQIALLEEQIKEMETPKIDTSSLEKYESKLQEAYDKLADLEAQAKAIENEINVTIPARTSKKGLDNIYKQKKAWKEVEQARDKVYIEVEKYEKEIEKIKATTSTSIGTAKYEKTVNALANATERLNMLGKKAKEVETKHEKAATSTEIGTSKYKKAVDALANATEHLEALGKKTKEVDAKQDKLVNKLKSVGREGKKSFRKASSSAQKFAVRLRSIIASAFIFNIISSGLRQLTEYMGNALKANKQFSASMSAIKGNLLTAFQPIYNAVMPALNSLMSGLQRVTGYIAGIINKLFGISIKASQESAKELYEQSSALNSVADSAKKANKQLADIDELQVINKSENVDSSSNNTGSNIVPSFGEIEVIDELPEWLEKSIENIKKLLGDLKIGDYFAVGEDVSDLVIQISDYIAEAIASINWDDVGKNVGAFLRGIKWLEILKSLWGVLDAAITGAIKFYFGMLKEAPFETALITAIAGWKFKGVASKFISLAKAHPFITAATIIAGIIINWDEVVEFLTTILTKFSKIISVDIATGTTIGISANMSEIASEIESFAESYKKLAKINEENIEGITAKYQGIKNIADEYMTLSKNYDNLTESQKTLVKDYSKIIGDNVENSGQYIDTLTGKWLGTSNQMTELINKTEAYYKGLAKQEILTELYTEQAKAQKKTNKALKELKSKTKELVDKYIELYDATGNADYDNIANLVVALYDANGNLSELDDTTRRFYESSLETKEITSIELRELQQLAQAYGTAENTLESINDDIESYSDNQQEAINKSEESTKKIEEFGERTGQVSKNIAGMDFSIDVNTDEGKAKVAELDAIFNDIEKEEKVVKVSAMTSAATTSVSNAMSLINRQIDTLKTPSVNIETSTALSKAQILRNSIETALQGINIGLKVDIQAKIKDAMTTAINIGRSAKVGIGEIKTYNPPYLASGAVIPPNKEFMAVLGDQKHGMNIEAPAELIKQMVKEGIAESGTAEDKEVNVYVYLEGDAEGVFNLVRVENDRVKKQTGDSAFA